TTTVILIQRNRAPDRSVQKSLPKAAGTAAPAPAESQPPATGDSSSSAAPATAQHTAELVLRQLPPGTRVLLDNALVGTVGSDGTLSHAGIPPGPHTLQISLRGYETITLTKDFTTASAVALTAEDVKLTKLPSTLDLRADPGTEVTVEQGGRTIRQVT